MEIKPIRSPSVRIDEPPIISTIEPPVTRRAQKTVIPEIDMPIINMPDTTIKYPVIDVPTQEEFDAAVRAEQKKQEEEKQEKTRGLPDTTPVLPQVQIPVQEKQDNRIISDQIILEYQSLKYPSSDKFPSHLKSKLFLLAPLLLLLSLRLLLGNLWWNGW